MATKECKVNQGFKNDIKDLVKRLSQEKFVADLMGDTVKATKVGMEMQIITKLCIFADINPFE